MKSPYLPVYRMGIFLQNALPAIVCTLLQLGWIWPSEATAQTATTIDWATLSQVKFEQKFSEELGISYDQATFGPWLLALNGKQVAIKGYIIPLDGFGANYVLSRNPNATCFFCGGAGPETVIELRLKPSALRRYKLDEIRTFKGILQMNASNLDQMTYVLLEAEPI